MKSYEEVIRDKINQTAGKDIYFNVPAIMELSETTSDKIISELLGNACSATHIMWISTGRKCLTAFPTNWIVPKIKKLVFSSIDINDYWDYRRLLELSEMISEDLLIWALSLGEDSDDYDIAEAHDDFMQRLFPDNSENIKD